MEFQDAYWASLAGTGLLLAAFSVPKLLSNPSLPSILLAIGGVGMILSSGYNLFVATDPGGPTEPNVFSLAPILGFFLAVFGFAVELL